MSTKLMTITAALAALIGNSLCAMPASATAEESGQPGGMSFEMPDLKGELLQTAFDTIEDESGGAQYQFVTIDYVGGQAQLNWTNWTVCEQYPKPGDAMPDTSPKITLYVKRPYAEGCFS